MKLHFSKSKKPGQRRQYKVPSLKKYGTVATITRGDGGYGVDGLGEFVNRG